MVEPPAKATGLGRFHNTTDLEGKILETKKIKAGSQNEKILSFFQLYPEYNYTPDEVMKILNLPGTPLTSIRRAITDLTKMGYLEKTDKRRPGGYGDLTYAWQLKKYFFLPAIVTK